MSGGEKNSEEPGMAQTTASYNWPRSPEPEVVKPSDSDPVEEHDPFSELVGSGGSEAAFTAQDAQSRRGNYLVPFGLPGSGKTTFLASLFKYIDEAEHLSNQIVIPERRKVPNYAGQAMLNQWQRVFNSGRFLGATNLGDEAIRELSYEVTPLKGQKTRLSFSVIEVSGEDLVNVVAKEGSDPKLPDAIDALFKNTKLRITIVLIVHPNQLENDLLFNNLFTWLNRNIKHRLQTFSLAILIANPHLALKRLHRRRPDTAGQNKLSGNISKIYLKEFAPKTSALFNSWNKKKRAIVPLHVGDIKTYYEDEMPYERIVRFDTTNSAQVFAWIYKQFTGRRLGATFMQRVLRKLNS